MAVDNQNYLSGPIVARFWARVKKTEGGCWIWTGGKFRRGYGALWDGSKTWYAHRLSYELHKGPIPPGAVIMHACDTRSCVNPEHLVAGTQRDNIRDAVTKGRWMTDSRRMALARTHAMADREALGPVSVAATPGMGLAACPECGQDRGVCMEFVMGTWIVRCSTCRATEISDRDLARAKAIWNRRTAA